MSDLRSSLDAWAKSAQPGEIPPFETIRGRRRKRTAAMGLTSATALVLVIGVATVIHSLVAGDRVRLRPAPELGSIAIPGVSAPSPYPADGRRVDPTVPDACDAAPSSDNRGYVTAPLSFSSGQDVLYPPGSAVATASAADVLAKFERDGYASPTGHGAGTAYFGLLSAETPSRTNSDGSVWHQYDKTPTWVVINCDVGPISITGPYVDPSSLPAAGTDPSPGPAGLSISIGLYDASGSAGSIMQEGRPSKAMLAQAFVSVPWTRNHDDSADGRQIGIDYSAAPGCAVFDHLSVIEAQAQDQTASGPVQVQVWLRIIDESSPSCATVQSYHAVVGLLHPLDNRPFVEGP